MVGEKGHIYFLIGKNITLIEEKINEISQKNTYLSFNKDSKEFFLDLQKKLNQKLIGKKFDLIIKNVDRLKNEDLRKLVLIIKDAKINIFFICDNEPTEFTLLLRKNKIKFEIKRIGPKSKRELRSFIIEILKAKKIKLSPSMINFLVENYDDNIDLLIQDLNKISALEERTLDKYLKYTLSLLTNNFKIHDLFLERNWPEFIHHLKKFILEDKSKDHFEILKLLNFLSNSLIRIFLIKNGKKIKANPFYLNKLEKIAKNISVEEIKRLQTSIAKTERKLKKFYLNIKDIPEDIYLNYLLTDKVRTDSKKNYL